ncbi:MAG TPA: DUF2336 domain-containing protein [Acetobacteraceae bacterium]|nr:DUF2336 domain-containing protein [Acetobacteraceae bacterium]
MSQAPPDLAAAEARRVRQGSDTHAEPEVLQALTSDRSVTVRAALALNPASPAAVNQTLAHDSDERVRMLLARRLAGLLPGLTGPDQARLQRQTYEVLATLIADTAVRVRAVIADVLKDMPHAPRGLVLQLAQDQAVMVAAPIIHFSPLLTIEDLIWLITAAQSPGTVVAVAGRPGIDTRVSDAIAASADNAAIRALLSNRTAQIREATLDALIAQAKEHPDWHEPLVHRPGLSPRAARALAEIVAANLVEVLVARADMPAKLADELRQRLTERLNAGRSPLPSGDPTVAEAMAAAEAAANGGTLNEDAVLAATRDGNVRLASALLAVAAGVRVSVVERAASLRSAKGLASLAWKAGFSMRAAGALQTLLGRLGPDAVLLPGPGGSFPLAIEEMRWQLDFLERMGR